MSNRTSRPSDRRASPSPGPEDSYPRMQEPKQSHAGNLLAVLSVMAVLGFGFWAAIGTYFGTGEKPAVSAASTSASTRVATAVATGISTTTAPTPAGTPTRPANAAPGAATAAAPSGGRVHVVGQGDTLYRIAQLYSTTVEAIMAANGFNDRGKILRVGDRLILP